MFSNNNSNSFDFNNPITFSTRLADFTQWHEQNTLEDDVLEEAIIFYANQSVQPDPNSRVRRRYIERNREQGHERVFNDYFATNPVYPPNIFRRRFRMQKHVFLRLVDTIKNGDSYFEDGYDACGRVKVSGLQKFTAAIRVLAYGIAADVVDEYLRISGALVRQSLEHFVDGVIYNFGTEYLRRPNEQDVERLLRKGEERGFPGMMGSIDYMHWGWKNCPTAWAGQFAGRNEKTTIILEAVASYDLWIWHAFFGTPGSCNDINVLQRSPVFDDILEGRAPQVNFVVNGHQYNMGYYLTDGIYPQWATFVKSISAPQIRKHKLFATYQESVRKDVERAFGVLQARFAFIKQPCLMWDKDLMGRILTACIILHNMIVEDERDTYQNYSDTTEFSDDRPTQESGTNDVPFEYFPQASSLTSYLQNRTRLRNRETHVQLKNDLIEHIWQKFN